MSSSDGRAFSRWLGARYAETAGFTALILLLSFQGDAVQPISGAYVHVIGDDVPWRELKTMLDASGCKWDGVAMFAEPAPGGGPLIDVVAKARLQERLDEVMANRIILNEAGFFDTRGRPIRIDPLEAGLGQGAG